MPLKAKTVSGVASQLELDFSQQVAPLAPDDRIKLALKLEQVARVLRRSAGKGRKLPALEWLRLRRLPRTKAVLN